MVLNFAGYSAIERRRDVDASLKMIEAAWAKEPQNPSITDSLGWAYVLTGRLDEAVPLERKSVGSGQSVSVRVDLGGRRFIKKRQTTRRVNRTGNTSQEPYSAK